MRYATLFLTVGALALAAPASITFAAGGHGGGGGGGGAAHAPATTPAAQPTTGTPAPQSDRGAPTQDTQVGPDQTGQPGEECGEDGALNRPGHAEDARGSAFNEDGVAGEHYAGEQPQNSKNTASVSQYDTACAHAKSK